MRGKVFSSIRQRADLSSTVLKDLPFSVIAKKVFDDETDEKLSVHLQEKAVTISSAHSVGRCSYSVATKLHAWTLQDLETDFKVGFTTLNDKDAVSLSASSNVCDWHRVALEGRHGRETEGENVLSSTLSTGTPDGMAWGLATSHVLGARTTVFSRYFREAAIGHQLVVQGVQRFGHHSSISPLLAMTFARKAHIGLGWTNETPNGKVAVNLFSDGAAPLAPKSLNFNVRFGDISGDEHKCFREQD
ncbi:hypothetical protein CYMTET_52631 [Cymbomonas tetramitiformis]|uniref:Uncharacterized protein n=1 Tax=Cymbomonas tetramitiformis TaxID=36881 RepID=A0AAE0EQL8_9CHLO|nr:hypothetical protein CYMTET_52631 [Cymbomonas tetramitiformis]